MTETRPKICDLAIPFYLRSRWALIATLFVAVGVPMIILAGSVIGQVMMSIDDPRVIHEIRKIVLIWSLICFCLMMAIGIWSLNTVRRYHAALRQQVTEIRKAQEALAESEAELRRSNEELQQFAYVASHDLQEPLRMVASYTQLLARRYADKLDKDAHEFINFAVDGATRMQDLINDLLAYSRVGTRGKPFEPVDSAKPVATAIANLKVAIEETGAQIAVENLPTVSADGSQLVQLFQNLIGNAIKFRKPGQSPTIRVSSARDDEHTLWRFAVADNGIGIDNDHFDKIFILFQRLHTREEYEGTGIGLALCRKIVERHGGKIWLESQSDHGATFFFTIPDQEKAESRRDTEAAEEDAEKKKLKSEI